MQAKITRERIAKLAPGDFIADTGKGAVTGFVVRRLPSGKLSYGVRYRVNGQRRWMSLGIGDAAITPEVMRDAAIEVVRAKVRGGDPHAEKLAARVEAKKREHVERRTVRHVLETYVERHCRQAMTLRSATDVEKLYERHVLEQLGATSIYDVDRAAVVELLDKVSDKAGAVTATKVHAWLRAAFNWWAQKRDDKFTSPITRGMWSATVNTRDRMLTDEEIRDVWNAGHKVPGPRGAILLLCLLTAQRRGEVGAIEAMDLHRVDGRPVWIIPAAKYKTKRAQAVPLSAAAQRVIDGLAPKAGYVMVPGGTTQFQNFSKVKEAADAEIAKARKADGRGPMPPWTLHDLRRTSRSLMSRIGIEPHIAERVLGHVKKGVEGRYDVHDYLPEKRAALDRLAAEIERIVTAQPDNVVALDRMRVAP